MKVIIFDVSFNPFHYQSKKITFKSLFCLKKRKIQETLNFNMNGIFKAAQLPGEESFENKIVVMEM